MNYDSGVAISIDFPFAISVQVVYEILHPSLSEFISTVDDFGVFIVVFMGQPIQKYSKI